MATRNCKFRIMENNWSTLTNNTVTSSSVESGYPLSNLNNTFRERSFSFENTGGGYTDEYIMWDFGHNPNIDFVALVAPTSNGFGFTDSVTISLEASNVSGYATPSLTVSLSYDGSQNEIYAFVDNLTDSNYRFWKLVINDASNTNNIYLGNIYLGDYITVTSSNINQGFEVTKIDPSEVITTNRQSFLAKTRTKYDTFTSLVVNYLSLADKETIRLAYEHLGVNSPFFISLDPTLQISDTLNEYTRYVVFNTQPQFQHEIMDRYTVTMEVREVL